MEVRGGSQEKDIGMPSSLGTYNNNNNNNNRESSSSKLSSTSTVGERRSRDILIPSQTLDHHHHPPPPPHHQSINLHQKQRNDPNPDPDPNPNPIPLPAPAPTTTTPPMASGSNSKTPVPLLPPPPPDNSTTTTIRYRECLKNHAANMGSYAVDGCGEFMPGGDEGTLESMKCAACDCHRNFHRKEIDGEKIYNYVSTNNNPNNKNMSSTPRRNTHGNIQQRQPPSYHHKFSPPQPGLVQPMPMMMAFGGISGGGVAADSSSEDLNVYDRHESNVGVQLPSSSMHNINISTFSRSNKKRFRTKFSQEQKDKMLEFAEKLGWKIQKQDEEEVHQFCSQFGVRRQVFKVWMHNNKQAMKKKQ